MAILLCGSCQSKENKQETPKPVKVKPLFALPSNGTPANRYSGTVEEENGTPLSFALAGTVQAVYVHLGEQVDAGQLVATLDPSSLQHTHNAARATLKQAEDAYRRMKELHDKGSLPEIKWVEVQSQLEQARAMEQIAGKNLRDCELRAPSTGIITARGAEPGQNVLPGIAVARLAAASSSKVKIAVPETEISSITLGQKARICIPALGNRCFTGQVAEKGVVANPLSRSYEVIVRVKDSSAALMPGMVAEVTLASSEAEKTCLIIPARIVQLDEQNLTFVWTIESGKAHKCYIQCGEYTADGVMVVSGLSVDDQIIAEGQQKVCEGTEVGL